MSAEEFMYVTGTTESATPASTRASHASSTWASLAMSAIEQPAARSGRITCWWSAVRMSADSAMKWTPQKTMNSASGRAAASRASLKESPVTSANSIRSEEHTSELQSRLHLVCRLLLEKKKKKKNEYCAIM